MCIVNLIIRMGIGRNVIIKPSVIIKMDYNIEYFKTDIYVKQLIN